MTAIIRALSAALLHFVWQGLVVTVVLWGALFALRRARASVRYAASCAALALLVTLPAITTWLLYAPGVAISRPSAATALFAAPLSSNAPAARDWLALVQAWAVPVWCCGVLLFSFRMLWGCARIGQLRRAGAAPDASLRCTVAALADRMGLTRPVRLLLSPVADSPSVTGWLRPIVLLPISAAAGLSTDQLEAVLAHELAHIRRHDYLVNLLQMGAETLLFYHPAVWWISAGIRHERELCCDDAAVAAVGSAIPYARALATLEKMRIARPAMALASTDGPLFYRIRRLVSGGGEYAPSKLSGAVALAMGLLCGVLCVNWARGQERAPVTVNTPDAVLLHRTPVEYPRAIRDKGVQGTVSVEVTLNDAGEVTDARIINGPDELRKPVLSSVLNWHFQPGPKTRVVDVAFDATAKEPEAREHPGDIEILTKIGQIRIEPVIALAVRNVELERTTQSVQLLNEQLQQQQQALVNAMNSGVAGERLAQIRGSLRELEARLEEARLATDEAKRGLAETQIDVQKQESLAHADRAPMEALAQVNQERLEQLGQLRRQLEELANASPGKLATIEIRGLTEKAADDLLGRLSLHVGDTLTTESMERARRAVEQFDAHLEFNIGSEPEGMVIRIHPMGAAGAPLVRPK
jgi:TonB family protein